MYFLSYSKEHRVDYCHPKEHIYPSHTPQVLDDPLNPFHRCQKIPKAEKRVRISNTK
jgi:hypothetical protein